jgi:hypothetical protein
MECKHCGKSCKNRNSLVNHERLCKLNPDKQQVSSGISNFVKYNEKVKLGLIVKKGTKGANQYTKAALEGRVIKISDETRKKLSKANKGRKYTPEYIEKLRVSMRQAVLNNPDSYTASNVSGRTPIIEYNGVKLKGTWEVETAKWLDRNNIRWTNVIKGFEYEWENRIHLYYPDFFLIDFNRYIEVKGYERDRDRAKWKVVDNLIVIKKDDISKMKNNVFHLDL